MDYIGGGIGSTLVAPARVLHLKQLSFILAPGLEFSDGETTMVLRIGAQYKFKLSRFSISPAIFFDSERAGGEIIVYGLAFKYIL